MNFFDANKHLGKSVALKDDTPDMKLQTKIKEAGQKTQRIGHKTVNWLRSGINIW